MAIDLSSLVISGPDIKPPRILFYAVEGFGKSTFAAGAPKPIFIQAEDGLGKLSYDRLPMVQSWSDLMEQLRAIYEQGDKYETVVLDTLDALEKILWADIAASKGKTSIEDIGWAKGYTFAAEKWGELLNALDALRDQGKIVILLAHTLIKTFSDPENDNYDQYRLTLHDKAAYKICSWADMVLFGNYKVYTHKGESDNRAKASGSGQRFIYTQRRPQHWGKNRYSLPYELPFPEKGAFDVVMSAMGEVVEQVEEIEEQEEQGAQA